MIFSRSMKMNISIKLPSRIFKMLSILKNVHNNKQKILFSKRFRDNSWIKKRNICERTMPGVYGKKISGRYLEKMTKFWCFEGRKRLFSTLFPAISVFSQLKKCPIWAVKIVFLGQFLRFWRKTDPKTRITPPKPYIFSLTFPWHRYLEWPWPWIYSSKG